MIDQMDIDQIVDVPDTPDRLAKHGIDGRNGVKIENQRSSLPCLGLKKFPKEGSRDQPMIIDSGSPGMPPHPPKHPSSSNNFRCPPTSSSSSSSSSRTANLFRKGVTQKNPIFLTHDSMHKHPESMRTSYTSKSFSSSHDDGILNLSKWNSHRPARGNVSPSTVPGNNRADFQKKSVIPNGAPFSQEPPKLASASHNGNEETNIVSRGGLSIAPGDIKKPDPSLDPVAPPRANKQKRLVRNGCISPNNTAKGKQLVGKDINSSVDVAQNNGSMASNAPPISTNIRELVAEENDSRTRKGKGVISHSYLSRKPDCDDKILHGSIGSSFTSSSEKAADKTDCNISTGKGIEESSAWRSTHNRNREMNNILSPDKVHHSIRERATPKVSVQHHEKRSDRRGKGINVANGDIYSEDPSLTSSAHFHTQSLKESLSHSRVQLGPLNGHRSAADKLIKRQKQGSDLSTYAECSTSVSDDLEVVLLSSPAEAANLRSTSSNVNNMAQIIEVDESSPQLGHDTHDEDVRSRQLEADELLARELQEQFYNEMPVFGVEEVNLQHQDGTSHPSSQRRQQQVLDTRLMTNLHRQSQSRSSSNASRRGSLARSSTLGRMTRLRSRFPGQPRTLSSSRGRNSIFPPDMDVDMRMHILGALEEFNGIGMSAGILHANRDFNENDYEMLLALDDDNNHGGASDRQIDGLPQSTVRSDYEEACAICLDTPTVGDTIRHLPCLHKFHKDCIDPWLRRRTSCPVCKSSIS